MEGKTIDKELFSVIQCITERGAEYMSFSIRLTAEEKALAESYARLHSVSVGEAFKRALFERIEDEYDIAADSEAYREYEDSGRQSRPASALWEELGL